MKFTKITFLLLFVCTFASAQLTKTEKEYGVTIEVRNNVLNDIYKAEKLFDNKKYSECYNLLIKSAKADPVIFNTYENLYKVSRILNNSSDEVINCFTNGKKIYNNNSEINFFLAELLTLKKDYKSAINEYENAINLQINKENQSSNLPICFSSRGYCYIQLMLFQQAEKDYSEFLKTNPRNAIGLLNRGFCYYKLGETTKAKNDWTLASNYGSDEARSFLSKLNQNKF